MNIKDYIIKSGYAENFVSRADGSCEIYIKRSFEFRKERLLRLMIIHNWLEYFTRIDFVNLESDGISLKESSQ